MQDKKEKKEKKKPVPKCPQNYPVGELQFYKEKPENFEIVDEIDKRNFYRQAAGIHKEVRAYARSIIKPGASLYECTRSIEQMIREKCGNKTASTCFLGSKNELFPYVCGQAFPLGTSVNECAAHYAALQSDDYIVKQKDIIKVDFGVHCNGFLIDSAFSLHWDESLDSIVNASKEATNEAIKLAGVDVPLNDLGKCIEEIITSYEYQGQKLQPVRNLSGHMVDRFTIHAGKSIPLYGGSGDKGRMQAGEVYACETFASTGKGLISEYSPTSHYMVAPEAVQLTKAMIQGTQHTQQLFDVLRKNFHTLAWNPDWIKDLGVDKFQLQLDSLVKNHYVNDYPKLVDKAGCYVSQFEHTFMIGEWGKEVFSRGDDY